MLPWPPPEGALAGVALVVAAAGYVSAFFVSATVFRRLCLFCALLIPYGYQEIFIISNDKAIIKQPGDSN